MGDRDIDCPDELFDGLELEPFGATTSPRSLSSSGSQKTAIGRRAVPPRSNLPEETDTKPSIDAELIDPEVVDTPNKSPTRTKQAETAVITENKLTKSNEMVKSNGELETTSWKSGSEGIAGPGSPEKKETSTSAPSTPTLTDTPSTPTTPKKSGGSLGNIITRAIKQTIAGPKKEKQPEEDPEESRQATISMQQIALRSMALQMDCNEKRKQCHALLISLDRMSNPAIREKLQSKFDELRTEILQSELQIAGLEHTIEAFRENKRITEEEVEIKVSAFQRSIAGDLPPIKPTSHKYTIVDSLDSVPVEIKAELEKAGITKEDMQTYVQEILSILNYTHQITQKTAAQLQMWKEKQFCKHLHTNYGRVIKPLEHFINDYKIRMQPKKMYQFKKSESKGGFGSVYFAKNTKTRRQVAIKKVSCASIHQRRECANETSFLSFCDHQNIVAYEDAFMVDNEIWLVMEYLDGGTIQKALGQKGFTEGHMAFIADQILLGLKYLHSNEIVHRDIKSANVMMTVDGSVKIVDLGLCADVTEFNSSLTGSGTFVYMAPEVIQGKPSSYASDIWSLGITMLEMANGQHPFQSNLIGKLFKILSNQYDVDMLLDNPKKWSKKFKHFVSLCLNFHPADRPSAGALLNHPFFSLITEDSQEDIAQIVHYCYTRHSAPVF